MIKRTQVTLTHPDMQRVGAVGVSPIAAQVGEPAAILLDARGSLRDGAFLYADEADLLADQLHAAATSLRRLAAMTA